MLPDFRAIFLRKDRIVAANSSGSEKMRQRGIELLKGDGSFVSDGELEVDGTRVTAGSFIIATGAQPVIPEIEGLEDVGYWTSHDAVFPDRQPESLVIIGGSAVGCEFAQIYSRLGTRVTLIEMGRKLLGRMDGEAAAIVGDMFEAEDIRVELGATVKRITAAGDGKQVSYENDAGEGEAAGDEVLLATGRSPALGGLDLRLAGISLEAGAVAVDANLRTSRPHIWACGDAIGGPMHSHVATQEGIIAALNCTAGGGSQLTAAEYRVVPGAVFTDPPLASVGLTEEQALTQGLDIVVGRSYYRDTERAAAMGETGGMVKVIAGAGGGELLGAHIVGAGADMLIHEVVVAMGHHLGAESLLRPRAMHIHPTLSETLARAAAGAR